MAKSISNDLKDDALQLFYPTRAILCSEQCFKFIYDYFENVDFFFFTVRIATRTDFVRVTAAKALLVGATEADKIKHQAAIDQPHAVASQLAEYAWVQRRNLVTTTANAFLWYLSHIIQEAILKKPNLLKSSQTLTVEEVLSIKTRGELVAYLVDKKVDELAYGGIRKMETFLSERLGVELFTDEAQRPLLTTFIELRNIYTHNRGIVNKTFLSRITRQGDSEFTLGKRHDVDLDEFARLSNNCIAVARSIDEAIGTKFGLRRKKYGSWMRPIELARENRRTKQRDPAGT